MSNINLTCDVCGREVFGCTFVNGMKFCAKCYQETFGETDKDRKIADLEAKLAEKEKDNLILYSMLYETLEKQGCENVASQIDQMTGWTYDKEADWLKGNRNYDQLKQQLHDLPKKIVEYFYDEIRHRAILEDDYCPDHNLERKYGVRKCLLENIRTTILKKYGWEDE